MGTWKLITSVNDPVVLVPAVTLAVSLPLLALSVNTRHITLLELAHSEASHRVNPIDTETVGEVKPKL
jgi:hypothetical protein